LGVGVEIGRRDRAPKQGHRVKGLVKNYKDWKEKGKKKEINM